MQAYPPTQKGRDAINRYVIVTILSCLLLAPFAARALPKTSGGPGGVGLTDGTSKLVVWLKPGNTATNGQIVGVLSPPEPWSDSSGYSNHFDYFNDLERPQWTNNAINGEAAVAFDGTDTLRMAAAGQYTDTDEESVFVVWDRDDNTTKDAVLGDQSFNNNVYGLYKDVPGGWQWLVNGDGNGKSVRDAGHGVTTDGLQMIVGVLSVQDNSIVLYDQGGQLGNVRDGTFNSPSASRRYDLADIGDQALDGLIAEFVAFKTNVNTVQRYLVENYLCSKFDMTLTGRDFYAGDTAGNGDYDWDVCGVGQDGSTQVDNGGMSGFGIEVTSGLDHGDWVLAGHNLEFENSRVTTGVPAGMKRRWQRVWFLSKTGNMDVTLAFDHSDASLLEPVGGTDFALLYSATDSPYSFAALAIAESVSGDTVSFAVPDASLLNGYYTLASDEDPPAVSDVTGGTGPGGVGLTDGTSDLILWLKPDTSASEGQQVNPWSDSSGTANDCSQNDVSLRPVNRINAINGQTAVEFDGTDDRLSAANSLSGDTSNETLFVVHDRDNNDNAHCVLGDIGNGNYGLYKKPAEGWQWVVVNAGGGKLNDAGHGSSTQDLTMIVGVRTVSGNSIALYDQGGFLRSGTLTTTLTPIQYGVGRKLNSGTFEFDGLMAEVVAFKTNLTTVQRYLVENYLCSKYDMTLTGRDFYAGDTAGNGDYDFDVFGIGRLSSSDEVTAAGHMGLGIAAPWGMGDNDWILAGHKVPSNTLVPHGSGQRWARVWYVDVTGTMDAQLSFDFSDAGLAKEGSAYDLLYSAVNAFSFSKVDADASVDGDRVHFDLLADSMLDGYYTVGIPLTSPGTVMQVH